MFWGAYFSNNPHEFFLAEIQFIVLRHLLSCPGLKPDPYSIQDLALHYIHNRYGYQLIQMEYESNILFKFQSNQWSISIQHNLHSWDNYWVTVMKIFSSVYSCFQTCLINHETNWLVLTKSKRELSPEDQRAVAFLVDKKQNTKISSVVLYNISWIL